MQGLNKVGEFKANLDTFANTLRSQVNGLHRSGQLSDGTTNIDFFNDSNPQTGAANFGLSAAVLASADNITNGSTGAAGDGGVALALSRLRESNIAGLGGKTFKNFYGEFVSGIGRDIQVAESSMDTQGAIIQQVDLQRQAEMGVNLDDEMANLLQYQRSYQAAAKALSVLNEVTEDLVNLIR
jgi:flagellar hook-associated protein 1 FlgK